MACQAASTTPTSPIDRSRSALADLIRSLPSKAEAAETDGGGQRVPDPCECEEILLDMDMDGARYLLLRMPAVDRGQVRLSPREQEIVRMVAQGYPNKIIADVLNISTWTVCTHLRRIFAKAGVTSRAAMVARFLESRGGRPDHALSNHGVRLLDEPRGRRVASDIAKLHL